MSIVSGGFNDNASGGGFPDAFAGDQGTMLINQLQSDDYVAGVSGWRILRDGTVEFNSGTFRGVVTAAEFLGTDFLINPAGLFFYSGTPALGNLIAAFTPAAGSDPFGNTVFAGFSQGDLAGYTNYTWIDQFGQIFLFQNGVEVIGLDAVNNRVDITEPGIVRFLSGAAFEQSPAQIIAAVGGVTPAQYIAMAIRGASTTTAGAHDQVYIQFNSAADNNSSSANLEFVYEGSSGGLHEQAYLDITGFNILAGSIVGVDPGSSPATPATWHTIALQNSYTAGANPGGFLDVPQIRLMADNKTLQFKGTLVAPNPVTSTVWGLLPASFPNANLGGNYGIGTVIMNHTAGQFNQVRVQNNSNLSLQVTPGTGITYDISSIIPTQ